MAAGDDVVEGHVRADLGAPGGALAVAALTGPGDPGVCSNLCLTVLSLLIHSAILVSTDTDSVATALSSFSGTGGVEVPVSTVHNIDVGDTLPSERKVLPPTPIDGVLEAVTHSFSVCVTMDEERHLISSPTEVMTSAGIGEALPDLKMTRGADA